MNSQEIRTEANRLRDIKETSPEWSPYLGPAVMAANTFAQQLDHHAEYLEKKKAAPTAEKKK